jgi:hypothetical protein
MFMRKYCKEHKIRAFAFLRVMHKKIIIALIFSEGLILNKQTSDGRDDEPEQGNLVNLLTFFYLEFYHQHVKK